MNQVFIHERTGVEAPAFTTPYWATHIIKRKVDGRLFFARHQFGHQAYFTGEGPTFEFHPDGYTVHDIVTLYQKGKDATVSIPDGETILVQSVYEKWWIQNGSKGELIKITITYLTDKVITIEVCDTAVSRTFLRERVTFVERAPD